MILILKNIKKTKQVKFRYTLCQKQIQCNIAEYSKLTTETYTLTRLMPKYTSKLKFVSINQKDSKNRNISIKKVDKKVQCQGCNPQRRAYCKRVLLKADAIFHRPEWHNSSG